MAQKIDVAAIVVNNYTTQEIVNFLLNMHLVGHSYMTKAIQEQNLGYIGKAESCYAQAEAVLKALDQKLNGQKTPTVVK